MTLLVATLLAGFSASAKAPTKLKKRSTASQNDFHCANSPAKKWGTYFCVSGTIVNPSRLADVQFGTCEGSDNAGESEPVKIVDFKSLKSDSNLAATSNEWKDASAFDVTSDELGKAVLYARQEAFKGQDNPATLRLKIGGKDVRLPCTQFGKH